MKKQPELGSVAASANKLKKKRPFHLIALHSRHHSSRPKKKPLRRRVGRLSLFFGTSFGKLESIFHKNVQTGSKWIIGTFRKVVKLFRDRCR